MEAKPREPHLRLVRRSDADEFEREVLAELRRISPEGSPPGREAHRWSVRLLIAVVTLEGVGLVALGWHYGGWQGAMIGVVVLVVGGAVRAGPILLAAVARRRDWREAEANVRARRLWQKSIPNPDPGRTR